TTGVLGGTPATGSNGIYNVVLTASNGIGTAGTQTFTLTITKAPAITSASSATFVVGTTSNFTVTTTGFPTPTLSENGGLPGGVTFNTTTGVLGGIPTGTGGVYNFSFTAHNGAAADATQSFTLTVNAAPTITSANNATLVAGSAGSFTLTSTSFPAA